MQTISKVFCIQSFEGCYEKSQKHYFNENAPYLIQEIQKNSEHRISLTSRKKIYWKRKKMQRNGE